MKSQRRSKPTGRRSRPGSHTHSKAFCLKVLRRLSEYVDDELPRDVCREIRQHLGDCPNCEVFLTSLRQAVSICRHTPTLPLSASTRARMRGEILRAVSPR